MRRAGWLIALLVLGGCGKGKPLQGQWAGDQQGAQVKLWLAEDGTYMCTIAGANSLEGTFEQTPDRLRLHVGDDVFAYTYKWLADDKISLQPIRGVRKNVSTALVFLTRTGPAPESISKAGGIVDATVPGSDSAVCIDNLHHLARAFSEYAMDYDGVFPPAPGWDSRLTSYLRSPSQQLSCPTLHKKGKAGGYALNIDLSMMRTSAISQAATLVLIYESNDEFLGATGSPNLSVLNKPRHGNEVNFAYADGHVAAGH